MSRADEGGGPPPPGLELAKDFPGLGPGGGGPTVDHTAVRDAISRLRKNLDPVYGSPQPNMSATWSGPGTVAQTAGLGNVGPESTGKWEVANNFGGNVEQAYKAFIDSYSELVEYVEKWAGAVETAITNYEKGHKDSSA
ncbi:hypothetical protein SAMN05444920_11342 [Nonomuraea solani]|uniref:Uncharacterized protein n=1 Tax=Nonomuraea solani TaxID=1144553 RepID=A0A1H6ERI5_9ACTN|nr:hypothetical protein [Nonomuraea solani]SEG99439.1 hypothetical protein SAMN05444920_11342 [Nonomuraea solani]